uniref:SMP-30/Gluconolactonase/LRE-like region domain-containing protein n=1 Tax=Grammatophora oceanica TaxID=210454 RepID=A0A7S1YNU4_9STRA
MDLENLTYERSSTVAGAFNQEPDQIRHILGESGTGVAEGGDIVYFCEDGGNDAGVHGRDSSGNFYSILDGPGHNGETTGLDLSPDRRRMYVSYQDERIIYEITRDDGLPFNGIKLDIKYHYA